MSDTPATPELPPSETQPLEMPITPPSAQEPSGIPGGNVCPNCGSPNSPNRTICNKCGTLLPSGRPERSTREKMIHFAGGFFGWFLVIALMGLLFREAYAFANLLILPANIIILIILAAKHKTRWIALGVLSAWAINFVLSLIFGAITNGACLMPFYLDTGW